MSEQKLPPSQQSLTQMSCHAKKRRSTDSSVQSFGKTTRRRETVSSRVLSTVRSESTAHFGGLGEDNGDAIDILSPFECSDEENGDESPSLLPPTKFVPSPHEKYQVCAPPLSKATAASYDSAEAPKEGYKGKKSIWRVVITK